ncbi:hypothetical protein [Nocardia seriolae]|nr:hypothetical protein [Nocardia seriolae]MTJ61851.1 hypothetical protein [Nocardia seriolae]MTJ74691.1 hypothetical protein [Nocardia seriolae]MTJ90113.1 hypothetical protein [Nocardia seriolae]MTK34079.1 hypothetical protein [Nocardia seriolae]MTK39796.1 hypothetical protein [Nocardia seriolae]
MRALPISRRISTRSTPPRSTGRAARLPRYGALTATAAVMCSVGVAFAPSAGAASTGPGMPENAAARIGIVESVAEQPNPGLIPDDFVNTAGYRPVVEAGMLVNPQGDCSSPVPLPAEFDLACKSHDLGYDLLRYAAAHGQPLGPWARQRVDAALEQRMHAACDGRANPVSRARCQVMADIATTAVDLNSIRQDYGNPIPEPFFERTGDAPSPAAFTLSGIGLAIGSATAATILIRRRARRTMPTAKPVRGNSDFVAVAL